MYHYFAEKNNQRIALSDLSHFAKYRSLGAEIYEVDDEDGNERLMIFAEETEEPKNE